MCGRYGYNWEKEQLQLIFLSKINIELIDLTKGVDVKSANISPMDDVLTVTHKDDVFSLEIMRWGFKLKNFPAPMFNSRIEEVVSGKSAEYWQSLLAVNPCLIPMNEFYEWKELDEPIFTKTGKLSKKKKKQPYKFTIDEELFFAAGYYRTEKLLTQQGEIEIKACTILTTVGNSITRPIHIKDRMPIILTGKNTIKFLTGTLEEKFSLCRPYPDENMRADTFEF